LRPHPGEAGETVMGINYYTEFATSKTHAALGVGIAAAFAAANPLLLMCAAAGYILGWVYLPTSKFFTSQVQGKLDGAEKAAQAAEHFDQGGFIHSERDDALSTTWMI